MERAPAADPRARPGVDPLPQILEKTKAYCNRLATASLYFVCREKIDERQFNPPLRFSSSVVGGSRHVSGVSLEYDYQLVRSGAPGGEKLEEKRTLLKEDGQPRNEPNAALKTKLYKHKYLVFGPVALLGEYWQPRHLYRYLGEDNVDGAKAFLIEAGPAGPPEPDMIYGKVWVREKDFAIVKIEWDQRCLGNFDQVKRTARMIGHGAEPRISIIGLYGIEKNGIRFPDRLTTLEDYDSNGGILRVSETMVVYRDYKFFLVQTEVHY
ncbi:MAG: hypothetical protein ABSA30_08345 [Candidatus Aminicenantales bacterium]